MLYWGMGYTILLAPSFRFLVCFKSVCGDFRDENRKRRKKKKEKRKPDLTSSEFKKRKRKETKSSLDTKNKTRRNSCRIDKISLNFSFS